MSASGINPGWQQEYFTRARLCVCDPTRGDSCSRCDGTDDGTQRAAIAAAVAAAVAAVAQRATAERRAS